MEGLVSEEMLGLLNQGVGLIGGWQLELPKDHPSASFVILDNSEFNFNNDFSDQEPLLLASDLPSEEISPYDSPKNEEKTIDETIIEPKQGEDKMEVKIETLVVEEHDLGREAEAAQVVEEVTNGQVLLRVEDFVETLLMYKCKACSFKTTEKSLLTKHISTTHLKVKEELNSTNKPVEKEKMVYMCGNCSEAFEAFSECRVHMAQNHKIVMAGKGLAKGGKEAKSKESQVLVKLELQDKTSAPITTDMFPKKNHKCPVSGCHAEFLSKENLSKHQMCHSSENSREFVCFSCSTKFHRWPLCANHLWRKHSIDIDLFSCKVCSYKTVTRVKMKMHEKTHNAQKEYMCARCGKLFSQEAQLINHQASVHKAVSSPLPNWCRKKECSQCGKEFANSKSVKKHIWAVHSKLKPYVCQVCGHSSATKSMLQIHLRQHTGEKPFTCSSCPYSTGDHNSLRRHEMRHSGKRPYVCPHCPYSSIQSSSLKHHLSTWHPNQDGLLSCPNCSFTTLSQESLNNHLLTEHSKQKESEEVYVSSTTSELVYQCLQSSSPFSDKEESDFTPQFTIVEAGAKANSAAGLTIPAKQGNKEIIIEIPKEYLRTQRLSQDLLKDL